MVEAGVIPEARVARPRGRRARHVWLVPVVLLVLVGWACVVSDVEVGDALRFAAAEALLKVLPGVLLWRLLRGRAGSLLEDLPLGTAAGHALALASYLLLAAAGIPVAGVLLPFGVVLAAVVARRLRWAWRTPEAQRAPAWSAWVVVAMGAACLAWFVRFQRTNPVRLPDEDFQSTDHPFLLSLAAELRHHVPPQLPFVRAPLHYHWFFFVDAANANLATGVELDVLVFRLLPLLYLVLTLLGFVAVAHRVTGSRRIGLVACAVTAATSMPTPLGWVGDTSLWITDAHLFSVYDWTPSPTQAFALFLSMPGVLLLVEVLRSPSRRPPPGQLVLLVLLVGVLMGAKASFIPVLGAGVAVAGLQALLTRRRPVAAVLAGLLLLVALVTAQVLLFGGESQALSLRPGHMFLRFVAQLGFPEGDTRVVALATTGAVVVSGWLGPCLGALGLLRLPYRRDPAVALLAGMAVASVAAAVLLDHPGLSQLWFLRAGLPWGHLLGVWGAAVVLGAAARPRHAYAVAGGSVLAGVLLAGVTAAFGSGAPSLARLALPYALVCLYAVAGAVALTRSDTGLRRTALPVCLVLVAALLVGGGVVATARLWQGPTLRFVAAGQAPVPSGGIEAARWLRSVSDPDDLVATNGHCRLPTYSVCNTLNHWVAAWAERRVLVEGWGYSARANRGTETIYEALTTPFWDQPLLRANDRLFTRPSGATRRALNRFARVDWLVVDTRFPADVRGLDEQFPRHSRFGKVVVYDLR